MLGTRAIKSGEVERLNLQLLFTPLVTLVSPYLHFLAHSTQIFSFVFPKSRVLYSFFAKDLFNYALERQECTSEQPSPSSIAASNLHQQKGTSPPPESD